MLYEDVKVSDDKTLYRPFKHLQGSWRSLVFNTHDALKHEFDVLTSFESYFWNEGGSSVAHKCTRKARGSFQNSVRVTGKRPFKILYHIPDRFAINVSYVAQLSIRGHNAMVRKPEHRCTVFDGKREMDPIRVSVLKKKRQWAFPDDYNLVPGSQTPSKRTEMNTNLCESFYFSEEGWVLFGRPEKFSKFYCVIFIMSL